MTIQREGGGYEPPRRRGRTPDRQERVAALVSEILTCLDSNPERAHRLFEEVFRLTTEWAVPFAARKAGGDSALAQDALMVAVERAWFALRNHRSDRSFESWLGTIIIRAVLDEKRKRDRLLPGSDAALALLVSRPTTPELRAAIDVIAERMPLELRVIFHLHFELQQTIREVAAEMGRSERWVTQRIPEVLRHLEPLRDSHLEDGLPRAHGMRRAQRSESQANDENASDNSR